MREEDILYTDGHDVIVTYSAIQVKKKGYTINGITKHGVSILSPVRVPFVILFLLGIALCIAGYMNLAPDAWRHWRITFSSFVFSVNEFAMYAGIVLAIVSGSLMLFLSERYAVTITTAEGEKNVVVSRHKEYINQIINALNEAFLVRVNSGWKSSRSRKQNFMVSAR